jgi:hypothetical protein
MQFLIRTILLLVFLFSVVDPVFSQQSDSPYQNSIDSQSFNWFDNVVVAKNLIPQLYRGGRADSADHLVENIEKQYSECTLGAYRMLRLIETQNLSSIDCDTTLLLALIEKDFNSRSIAMFRPDHTAEIIHPGTFGYRSLVAIRVYNYDTFIVEFADSLSQKTPRYSVANAICRAIAQTNDSLYSDLFAGKYAGTCLDSIYFVLLRRYNESFFTERNNIAIALGLHLPYGKIRFFKPAYGIELISGVKGKRIGCDYGIGLFSEGTNQYYRERFGEELSGKKIATALYGTVNINYKLRESRRFLHDILVGVNMGGIRVANMRTHRADLKFRMLSCYLGIKQRYFYTRAHTKYWGWEVRANLINISSIRGDVTGGSISINMIWGSISNSVAVADAVKFRY